MDNVTHSLVGLMVGEAAYEIRKYNDKPDDKNLRRFFLVSSLLANNFPDLDIFYSGLFGELGYLVHHRGHTHTLLASFPLAALLFACCFYFAKVKKIVFEKEGWKWIAALSVLGPIVHIWMDSLNSYGVHPFWPISNKWFYGDSLFIVEPWIWVLLSVTLFRLNKNKYLRLGLAVITLTAILLCFFTGFVPIEITLVLIGFSVLLYSCLGYLSEYRKTFTGLVLFSLLILSFNRTCKYLKKEFFKYYQAQYEQTDLRDLILTPYPANPFCWGAITVEMSEEKTHYFMRRGVIAAFPRLFSLEACERLGFVGKIGEFQSDPKLPQVHWMGQVKTDLRQLKNYQENSCLAHEFLQFARAPYLVKEDKKINLIDLRFMRKSTPSFAQVVLVDNPKCLSVPAPWVPPRSRELDEYDSHLLEPTK